MFKSRLGVKSSTQHPKYHYCLFSFSAFYYAPPPFPLQKSFLTRSRTPDGRNLTKTQTSPTFRRGVARHSPRRNIAAGPLLRPRFTSSAEAPERDPGDSRHLLGLPLPSRPDRDRHLPPTPCREGWWCWKTRRQSQVVMPRAP